MALNHKHIEKILERIDSFEYPCDEDTQNTPPWWQPYTNKRQKLIFWLSVVSVIIGFAALLLTIMNSIMSIGSMSLWTGLLQICYSTVLVLALVLIIYDIVKVVLSLPQDILGEARERAGSEVNLINELHIYPEVDVLFALQRAQERTERLESRMSILVGAIRQTGLIPVFAFTLFPPVYNLLFNNNPPTWVYGVSIAFVFLYFLGVISISKVEREKIKVALLKIACDTKNFDRLT